MKKITYKTAIIGVVMTVFGAACGGGGDNGDAAEADRAVEVAMTDNAFDPTRLTVAAGETVTFKFTNNGAVAHDAFIGDAEAQTEHGESMATDTEGHNMDGGDALLLEPGDSGELTYTFDEAGEILIGCHQPGHYDAGMKSTVSIS